MNLYRAVDKAGNTLDFLLTERRNRPATARFLAKALCPNGIQDKIVIDKRGANAAGIREVNKSSVGLAAQPKSKRSGPSI